MILNLEIEYGDELSAIYRSFGVIYVGSNV
jgi:hypothetical protein